MTQVNRVWIELDRPTSKQEGDDRAALLSDMLKKLGIDYGSIAPVFWHDKKQCYCFTIDGAGCFLEAADNGHWYSLDYAARPKALPIIDWSGTDKRIDAHLNGKFIGMVTHFSGPLCDYDYIVNSVVSSMVAMNSTQDEARRTLTQQAVEYFASFGLEISAELTPIVAPEIVSA